MKDKYDGNYLANLTGQMSNNGTKYTICIKDGKAYQALTVQGMKSYTVCPGDGKLYNVSEGTTTYSIEDDDGNQWKSADILSARPSILTTHILTQQQTLFTSIITSTAVFQAVRVR